MLVVIAAVSLGACSSGTKPPESTSTKTVTVDAPPSETVAAPPPSAAPSPPPASSAAAGPHSELINVTLPAGTVPACCGKHEGLEVWLVTTPYDYTVQSLRQQLPIKSAYYGVPWCSQEINGKLGSTEWDWMDDKNIIQVHINQTGQVTIIRQPDDEGRYGCDSP